MVQVYLTAQPPFFLATAIVAILGSCGRACLPVSFDWNRCCAGIILFDKTVFWNSAAA